MAFPRAGLNASLGENPLDTMLLAFDLTLLGCIAYLCWSTWPAFRPLLLAAALPLGAIAVCLGVTRLGSHWHGQFALSYDQRFNTTAFEDLADMTPPPRVCVLSFRAYPFFGSRRHIHVCQPIRVPSPRWLLQYLRNNKVGILAVQAPEAGPPEALNRYDWTYIWATEHRELFDGCSWSSSFVLFRVNPATWREPEAEVETPPLLEAAP
jgi:hypothetical protein